MHSELMPDSQVDLYSSIGSCVHVDKVLASRAKENVLTTYRQAVKIVLLRPHGCRVIQKKDGSEIAAAKLMDHKSRALRCSDCLSNGFHQTFVCLQCPHVGCVNTKHNHAHRHYKLSHHSFAIDAHNGLLFCFQCGDYVNHQDLELIRTRHIEGSPKLESLKLPEATSDSDIKNNYTIPPVAAVSGLKGFVNLGSTCFMSCILQTFIHNPLVRYQFFNNDFHYFNCDSMQEYHSSNPNVSENNACITCSIDVIFRNFYTSTSIEGYGMTNLLMTAWYKNKSLAGFEEQDAHELWQFLLNELHSDHERSLQRSSQLETEHNLCQCITHSTFSGTLASSIQCQNCQETTETVDPMIDLSLEIGRLKHKQKTANLYDCLDLFTSSEKLDVMYTCNHCGEKSKAMKSLKIKKLAPVLSIQLKRFEHNKTNDGSSKVETPVSIPIYLDISKYTSDENATNLYELFAVVCHVGLVNTGHYIVVVKDGEGRWLKFDDSVISLIAESEVSSLNGYLLFYISHKIT